MFKLPVKRKSDSLYPLTSALNLQREMDRLLDFSFPGLFDAESVFSTNEWMPAVDIYDNKDSIVIKADLPGLTKEDIHVTIHDNILTIQGEKKHESEVKEKTGLRIERYQGQFRRSIGLPYDVDANKANAVFKDGVLELNLTKKEDAKPKQITIDVK